MIDIEALISNYCSHAKADHVGLWQIAGRVSDELGGGGQQDIRQYTLAVIRGLISRGVFPGDYTPKGFLFWDGGVDDLINQIDAKWQEIEGLPSLADPICWFSELPN